MLGKIFKTVNVKKGESNIQLPISCHWSFSIPPENIRKPGRGDTSDMKWVGTSPWRCGVSGLLSQKCFSKLLAKNPVLSSQILVHSTKYMKKKTIFSVNVLTLYHLVSTKRSYILRVAFTVTFEWTPVVKWLNFPLWFLIGNLMFRLFQSLIRAVTLTVEEI